MPLPQPRHLARPDQTPLHPGIGQELRVPDSLREELSEHRLRLFRCLGDAAPGPAAVTFEDTFDGPAGSAADGSKWQLETGDNVNNHERQYYTGGNSNAALDGQGNLVISARKENPGNYQCWYGTCEYTSARLKATLRIQAKL
ncbi:glycoside hydrolase family 16 protein, partial [Streptomyces halstedii]|uniref:glycoside hydrolase family 16 protein n=1 Tax=Streptomyces halstedii TaxID=1944 RepID=UPI003481246A